MKLSHWLLLKIVKRYIKKGEKMNFLKGYLTYIIGGLCIIGGIALCITGNTEVGMSLITQGLIAFGIRRAIG